jgi:RNA polymerase sigma-54 factor
MALKPSLQVRLSQHLALTPQLQQSIRLLQLSTLELQQEVDQMLQQNPFLENDDEAESYGVAPVETAGPLQSAATRTGESDEGDGVNGEEALAEINGAEFGGTERDDWENGTEGDDFDGIGEAPAGAAAAGGDDEPQSESGSASISLQEHLRAQMAGMRLADDDRAALQVLIESLDADGYLADPIDDIAERLAAMLAAEGDERDERRQAITQQLQIALKWLQSMEPAGVGARGLGECLCLQLRQLPASPERTVALAICNGHLEVLARRDLRRLALLTHADEALVRAAQALIVQCEPRPARGFQDTEGTAIVPDVIVRRAGRGWRVVLNPEVLPKLRINELYARAARGARGSGLGPRLQEARWFMKNIQQRFDTILRVSTAIVERQKAFFTHGEIAMKPLVLREIADELGLHESTISRVTTAKYLSSPIGTYELKYFFGSSLATDAGGNASSTAVRALIKQLVGAEQAARPLSDSQLSHMLEEQGIQVARRTVAKYREALKIAPANLRRAG